MSADFSPGPWCIDPLLTGARWNVYDAEGNDVAIAQQTTARRDKLDPRRDANARLLEAATDMLDALRAVAAWEPDREGFIVPNRYDVDRARDLVACLDRGESVRTLDATRTRRTRRQRRTR